MHGVWTEGNLYFRAIKKFMQYGFIGNDFATVLSTNILQLLINLSLITVEVALKQKPENSVRAKNPKCKYNNRIPLGFPQRFPYFATLPSFNILQNLKFVSININPRNDKVVGGFELIALHAKVNF